MTKEGFESSEKTGGKKVAAPVKNPDSTNPPVTTSTSTSGGGKNVSNGGDEN